MMGMQTYAASWQDEWTDDALGQIGACADFQQDHHRSRLMMGALGGVGGQ